LIWFRNRPHAFVRKFLQALTVLGLNGVNVALRIGRYVVHRVELPGLPAAITEGRQDFERVP
jgi:hypothetical protein